MCIKKFDAEIFFLSNLQGFNLVWGVSSKSYLLPSFIFTVASVECCVLVKFPLISRLHG